MQLEKGSEISCCSFSTLAISWQLVAGLAFFWFSYKRTSLKNPRASEICTRDPPANFGIFEQIQALVRF
jgi:hypothetical protein